MAVISPIVHPAANLTTIDIAELAHCCGVTPHSVGNDHLSPAMALEGRLQKRQSSRFILAQVFSTPAEWRQIHSASNVGFVRG